MVELSLLYVAVQYVRIHCAFAAAVRQAALLAQGSSLPGCETDDALVASAIRARAWKVDRRLAAYLGAYLLSQGFSVVHRIWQVFGQAPEWLAVAQCATQPAQGTCNLLVLVHHAALWRHSCRVCYRQRSRVSHSSMGSTGFTRDHSVDSCEGG